MAYMVVKNAGHSWRHHYESDPKVAEGLHSSHSAHFTHTGKMESLKPSYESFLEAEQDCKECNIANPSGDYAVCVIAK